MTPEDTNQLAAQLLLSGLACVLFLGFLAAWLSIYYVHRRRRARFESAKKEEKSHPYAARYQPSIFDHACRWVVVKSRQVAAVQSALGLLNPTPCSWGEGLSRLTSRKLFVSPPIGGWILVIGPGLPDPADDVDECFHFISRLSRALGHVQFFSANRALNHHAWVRADRGRIQRAYAWAGETLWNQGLPTPAEQELALLCLQYGEAPGLTDFSSGNSATNAEKIPLLAARWSFDPTTVNESMFRVGLGVAGDLTHGRNSH